MRWRARLACWMTFLAPCAAIGLDFEPVPCRTGVAEQRCFALGPEGATIETDVGSLSQSFSLAPVLPGDPGAWHLVQMEVRFSGTVRYRLEYSATGSRQAAALEELSVLDANGLEILRTSHALEPLCGGSPDGSDWACADGNSLRPVGAAFGAFGEFTSPRRELPAFSGPLSLHVRWSLVGSGVPDLRSHLVVDGIHLSYVVVVAPEPAAGTLVAGGVLLLAWASRHTPVRRRAAPAPPR